MAPTSPHLLRRSKPHSETPQSSSYRPDAFQLAGLKSAAVPAGADLKDFFDYCLPVLERSKEHIPSEDTRSPAPYDRHLHQSQRLRKVVYHPSLVTDLEDLVDGSLAAYLEKNATLPPPNKLFPDTPLLWRSLAASGHKNIVDESSLQSTIENSILKHCMVVASTLECQLPHWCAGHLDWTKAKQTNQASADGSLRLVRNRDPVEAGIDIPPISGQLLEAMQDFRVLGVWEFKSLASGSREVFHAVRAHAMMDEFPWEGCIHGASCIVKCRNSARSPDSPLCFEEKVGPDAVPAICKSLLSLKPDPPPVPECECTTPKSMLHAQWMLQQIYAELVIVDATFASLHAGIYEIIMLRDRRENNLYITDILRTDTPGYAKRATGLFIAMLKDAKQRSAQLRTSPVSTISSPVRDSPGPARKSSKYNLANRRPLSRTPSSQRIFKPLPLRKQEKVKIQRRMLKKAFRREWLLFRPDKGSESYSFATKVAYLRIPPNQEYTPVINPKDMPKEIGPLLCIKAHPWRTVSKGTLTVSKKLFTGLPNFSNFLVVKHSTEAASGRRLYHEYQAYCALRLAGVTCIPKVIGFFQHANIEKKEDPLPFSSLILEDVGTSLFERKELITPRLIKECRKALEQIHAIDMCHGNLSLSHIIVRHPQFDNAIRKGELPKVSLIGFRYAQHSESQFDKDRELRQLLEMLNNPSNKHSLDEDEESLSFDQQFVADRKLWNKANGVEELEASDEETSTEPSNSQRVE